MRIPIPWIALACVVTLAAPTQTHAQVAEPPRIVTRPVPNFFEGLALTNAQQSQLATLTAATKAARDSVLSAHAVGAPLSTGEVQALQTISRRHQAALLSALTADQRATFEANVRAWETERAKAAAGAGGTNP